jgi:hypothetical protein
MGVFLGSKQQERFDSSKHFQSGRPAVSFLNIFLNAGHELTA